jgi:hypothetical protein
MSTRTYRVVCVARMNQSTTVEVEARTAVEARKLARRQASAGSGDRWTVWSCERVVAAPPTAAERIDQYRAEIEATGRRLDVFGLGYVTDSCHENVTDRLGPEPEHFVDADEAVAWWAAYASDVDSEAEYAINQAFVSYRRTLERYAADVESDRLDAEQDAADRIAADRTELVEAFIAAHPRYTGDPAELTVAVESWHLGEFRVGLTECPTVYNRNRTPLAARRPDGTWEPLGIGYAR